MDHLATEPVSTIIGHQETPMLDLQPFCGTDELRPYLMKPFSRDGFTWATNGHILIRVSERPDISDVDKKFNQAKPLEGIESRTFFRPSFELPPTPTDRDECEACDGRGHEHECPDCECLCEACGGEGDTDKEKRTSTSIELTEFALNYIRLMLSLPGIEIAALPDARSEAPLLFRFEGGAGALMPLKSRMVDRIDIKLKRSSNPGIDQ